MQELNYFNRIDVVKHILNTSLRTEKEKNMGLNLVNRKDKKIYINGVQKKKNLTKLNLVFAISQLDSILTLKFLSIPTTINLELWRVLMLLSQDIVKTIFT